MWKKLLIILMFLLALPTNVLAKTSDNISVYLDGQLLKTDAKPVILNGRTLVPLRAIFEALGAEVQYEAASQIIRATKDDNTITLTVGKTEAQINDEIYKLEVPPKIINSRTLVPVRFVSEALEATVEWDSNDNIVFISSKPDFSDFSYTLTEFKKVAESSEDSWLGYPILLPNGNVYINGFDSSSVYYYKAANQTLNKVQGLEPDEIDSLDPNILSDGSILLYKDEQVDNKNKGVIYIVNPETGERSLVPLNVSVIAYSLSVSVNDEILFFSEVNGQTDLFKTNLKGETVRLTNTPDIDEFVGSWSPDGKRIAFVSTPLDKKKAEYISIIDSDGSGQINFYNYPGTGTSLEWSPDGKHLAYSLFSENTSKDALGNLWVINTDGSSGKCIFNQFDISYIGWSPDGTRLYGRSPVNKLVVMDWDGSNVKMLYDVGPPTWFHDDQLLFVKDYFYLWDLKTNKTYPLIQGTFEEFWQTGGVIYFSSQGSIWKLVMEAQPRK